METGVAAGIGALVLDRGDSACGVLGCHLWAVPKRHGDRGVAVSSLGIADTRHWDSELWDSELWDLVLVAVDG